MKRLGCYSPALHPVSTEHTGGRKVTGSSRQLMPNFIQKADKSFAFKSSGAKREEIGMMQGDHIYFC